MFGFTRKTPKISEEIFQGKFSSGDGSGVWHHFVFLENTIGPNRKTFFSKTVFSTEIDFERISPSTIVEVENHFELAILLIARELELLSLKVMEVWSSIP